MAESHTNKHWTRAKLSFLAPIILFVLVIILFVAIRPEPEAQPGVNPIFDTAIFTFFFSVFLWPIPFGYFVSKDKIALSEEYQNTITRHWLTTILFCYITVGTYALWYIFHRIFRPDINYQEIGKQAQQSLKRVYQRLKTQASGIQIIGTLKRIRIAQPRKLLPGRLASDSNEGSPPNKNGESTTEEPPTSASIKQEPRKLALNAKGGSVSSDRLTSTGTAVLGGSYLHDQPMINYLSKGEHPHYHFDNINKGLSTQNERLKQGWSGDYRASMLITTAGIHLFVGKSAGDFHEFISYETITGIQTEYALLDRRGKFIIDTNYKQYQFWTDPNNFLRKYDKDEMESARQYIEEQIKIHETKPDDTEKDTGQVETTSDDTKVSASVQASANDDDDARTKSSSESDEGSDTDPEPVNPFRESLEEADDLHSTAGDRLEASDYDQALRANQEATRIYEDILEEATASGLIETNEIEQELTTVRDQRQAIHRQQLQSEVETLHSDLRHAVELADDNELEAAKDQLADLQSALTSAKKTATKHGFDDLHNELKTIERQCNKRVDAITDRLSMSIPDTIPTAPSVSVDYDTLSDEEPIGGGGNADVSKAIHSTAEQSVTLAIKEPRMRGTLHREQVNRMLKEAETWDRLDDHNHIVDVVDYDSDPYPWIAMEHMDGGHLGERSGEMPLPQAVWTALTITRGVRHAHNKGVAHLDLKPANVLFRTVEDGWDVPKVADWGLSKHLLDHSNSVEGLSPQYASPEQFDDEYGSTDNITDIYQLGTVFYELFTGSPPFDGKPFKVIRKVKDESPTPPSEIADVPNEIDDILLTALAKQKDDRYEDILYLRDDLEEVLGSVTGDIDSGGPDDDEDEDGEEELPVNRDVHENLVSVVETAPNRAWINEYFDWVATLLEETDLDKRDSRLVTSIRTEQKSLPVTISWRYCLKGFPSEGKVAAILPHDSAAIDELAAAATYTQRFEGNSGPDPYYYQLPASTGDFFIEEFEDDWLRAVQEQCDIDRNARNPGTHEPAVCIAALDSTYRERVLDDAF